MHQGCMTMCLSLHLCAVRKGNHLHRGVISLVRNAVVNKEKTAWHGVGVWRQYAHTYAQTRGGVRLVNNPYTPFMQCQSNRRPFQHLENSHLPLQKDDFLSLKWVSDLLRCVFLFSFLCLFSPSETEHTLFDSKQNRRERKTRVDCEMLKRDCRNRLSFKTWPSIFLSFLRA